MSNLSETIKSKLVKIQALMDRGSTDGERQAATEAFNKLVEKYDLSDDDMLHFSKIEISFRYFLRQEIDMLFFILRKFSENEYIPISKYTKTKNLTVSMTKLDAIVCHSAYEYFRRHYRKQLKEVNEVYKLNKHTLGKSERSSAKKNIKNRFFVQYLKASNLITDDDTKQYKTSISDVEQQAMLIEVEGGIFNKQLNDELRYIE